MSNYTLSIAADRDIKTIAQHSIEAWGAERAERYILELHLILETLAAFPALGRNIERIRTGYQRFEHQSHAIFYRRNDAGILVIRVLHRRQQPATYL